MSGWTAEDSNLNTKCAFCNRMVVPFLTIRVVDFRTRSLSIMANLMTPAASLETLSTATSTFQITPPTSSEQAVDEKCGKTEDIELGKTEPVVSSEEKDINGDKGKGKNEETFLDPSHRKETGNESEHRHMSQVTDIDGNTPDGSRMKQTNIRNASNALREPIVSTPITVPYLSPLVLRKELENMLEREGDTCLVDPSIVDEHPIIFWNLIWYYERIAVKSHLPSLCVNAKSLNGEIQNIMDASWSTADEKNVQIRCKWDNERLHEEAGGPPPIYTQWRITESTDNKEISEAWLKKILDEQTHDALKPHMQLIISGVQQNDLVKPIKTILEEREKNGGRRSLQDSTLGSPNKSSASNLNSHPSVYREIMFLTLVSLGQDNIDLTAFDREYRRAFENLPEKYLEMAQKHVGIRGQMLLGQCYLVQVKLKSET
jgi:hypothetical protein